jgi:hypothetical protein
MGNGFAGKGHAFFSQYPRGNENHSKFEKRKENS